MYIIKVGLVQHLVKKEIKNSSFSFQGCYDTEHLVGEKCVS